MLLIELRDEQHPDGVKNYPQEVTAREDGERWRQRCREEKREALQIGIKLGVVWVGRSPPSLGKMFINQRHQATTGAE